MPHPDATWAVSLALALLGVLQYRWIDEVSRAQESKATSRLREEVRLIVDALDTEITRAVLVFTTPDGKMDDALERAWATWKQGAPWPRVVCCSMERSHADRLAPTARTPSATDTDRQ
jgi:hypothetical protein